jgi:hypothetical protein
MMDEATFTDRPSVMNGLFQGIQHKAGMCRSADAPAHDVTGIDVDDEGDIDHPCPCRNIGKVRHPQPVGSRCMKLAVNVIKRARCCFVTEGGAYRGLSGILCARPVSLLTLEPVAKDDCELGPCLEPFTRRPFPVVGCVVENQIQ